MIPALAVDPGLIRALGLFVPLLLFFALWRIVNPCSLAAASALLATMWNLPAILLINELALKLGWWHFQADGGLFRGMPFDLCLGWILLWGGLSSLLNELLERHMGPYAALGLWGIVLCILDCIYMPLMSPVLQLGPNWLLGEALLLCVCYLPSQLLAQWTRKNIHLPGRVLLQIIAFSGLCFGVFPAAVLQATGRDWALLNPAFALPLLLAPAILGLSAVQEFALRGQGTPLPFDPPKRLVTSGIYSYVRNPMQVAQVLLFAAWGASLNSLWVASLALSAFFYSAGLAAGDEQEDLHGRFGASWDDYRRNVRNWIPRWHPYQPNSANLYWTNSNRRSDLLRSWLAAQHPAGLQIICPPNTATPANPGLRYDPKDSSGVQSGLDAFARALEHIHFAWAMLGFTLRLPPLSCLARLGRLL